MNTNIDPMTIILDLGYGPGEYHLGCPGRPWYIGYGPEGEVSLYSSAGAELVRYGCATDLRATRRAVRACRRAMEGGPMRIRVTSIVEYGGRDHSDTCEVYGWRAALTAARCLRREHAPGGCDTPRRRARAVYIGISDARLADVLWPDD